MCDDKIQCQLYCEYINCRLCVELCFPMYASTRDVKQRKAAIRARRAMEGRSVLPPVSMGEPVVIGPVAGCSHRATIVWLPCLMWGAHEMMCSRLPRLRSSLPARALDSVKIVILCPPLRPVSCYGGKVYHAWHDYLTDHGGDEGHPNVEERISLPELEWARKQV